MEASNKKTKRAAAPRTTTSSASTRKRATKAAAESTPSPVETVAVETPAAIAEAPAAAATEKPVAAPAPEVTFEEIAECAYYFWLQRGCPLGSPEEDWLRAEEALRSNRSVFATA